jgi:hypothetical protein
VVALSPTGLTINALLTDAIRREVERLQHTHNGGRAFPLRYVEPKVGRPVT